ncbi:hypothetical protein ACRQF6_06065 [Actinotignum sp. GS-2025f]|uniref:hypothetical protein n=1 Tax=Actinotignum TaxID=1653174 RepID=UPI002A80A18E|nr:MULTISPECIES: hypothetical protein [Actinotignum]MDY5127825.1 hypothetical protein [Actinotignum sp. SLA_B059]MDY5156102.1 hypothetical protein [Actinotignum timonense]
MAKRKKKDRGGVLTWVGILAIALASIADFVLFFFDNGSRYILYTLPLWFLGIGCFAWLGRSEERRNNTKRTGNR